MKPTVLCYYFPNYHPGDPRNARVHGPGWSEWELVKGARPRFEGHDQPRVPAWGYSDESDPAVMTRKVALAAEYGVDAFIFDWYWYEDGPFLERALEQGYLIAANRDRVRFCCMWANHDWQLIHPIRRDEAPGLAGGSGPRLLYPGRLTPSAFAAMTDRLVGRYFTDPSYFSIEGRPYFSVYELAGLVAGFGSVPATRAALEGFRRRCVEAGLPGLHLNAVVWGQPLLPGETAPADPWRLAVDLGFDSATSYVWVHHARLYPDRATTPYEECLEGYLGWWAEARSRTSLPYFPNLTVGWDSSPRCLPSDRWDPGWGYPFTSVVTGNNPEAFEDAARRIRARQEQWNGPAVYTVNCWNEWTEGSYLEPDRRHGTAYLSALRRAFAAR